MEQKDRIQEMHTILLQMKKESRSQSIESKIQTIALIAVFVFGIATIGDLISKVKGKIN